MTLRPADGEDSSSEVPFGQKLYDNWPLLLVAGILIMVAVYTGWGLWEVRTLPPAALP